MRVDHLSMDMDSLVGLFANPRGTNEFICVRSPVKIVEVNKSKGVVSTTIYVAPERLDLYAPDELSAIKKYKLADLACVWTDAAEALEATRISNLNTDVIIMEIQRVKDEAFARVINLDPSTPPMYTPRKTG